MSAPGAGSGRFSALLLEGLDHYRKGKMMEAVRAWEEAYLLEPSNLRAREFLRSALERIHKHMGPPSAAPAPSHPWLPETPPVVMAPPSRSAKPSPWDDGPSMAIPQQPERSVEDSGAWGIHEEPLPVPDRKDDEVEAWRKGARELLALNDFSGALELTQKILERKAGDPEAQQLHDQCEETLTHMFESKLGSTESRPRVVLQPDEIIWLNLDPRAGFVLAQIDGEVSFEDLYAICGLKRLDTARILSQLLEEGVISVQGARPIAKRAMPRS